MKLSERDWLVGLGAATLLVGGLTLGPAFFPQPQVPTVTRVSLPVVPPSDVAPASASTQSSAQAEPPVYPTTGSVTPLISGRLNLNTASAEQLEALPKVGPALARRIIEGRPYRSLNDLDQVKGVGETTLRRLAPLVTW